MAMMAMAENIAREDLTAYEISLGIRAIQDQFKTAKHLAEAIGVNRTALYKYLAFADLPDFVITDLEVSPGILGRDAAMDIMSTIKKHGQTAIDVIEKLWPQVKSGHMDQTKLAPAIEASILRGTTTRTDRDIKKLFVGKEQAGSITRDASFLTIKIKSAALSEEQEVRLRTFVEGLLKG
jgi:ParB family chromosome partitioning protein